MNLTWQVIYDEQTFAHHLISVSSSGGGLSKQRGQQRFNYQYSLMPAVLYSGNTPCHLAGNPIENTILSTI